MEAYLERFFRAPGALLSAALLPPRQQNPSVGTSTVAFVNTGLLLPGRHFWLRLRRKLLGDANLHAINL
jgi:hypothetical protein